MFEKIFENHRANAIPFKVETPGKREPSVLPDPKKETKYYNFRALKLSDFETLKTHD